MVNPHKERAATSIFQIQFSNLAPILKLHRACFEIITIPSTAVNLYESDKIESVFNYRNNKGLHFAMLSVRKGFIDVNC